MRPKDFLGQLDNDRIVQAIAAAEQQTSGEIRVYIRRGEIDDVLGGARTQFAVIGDEGIHQRCGETFWQQLVAGMQIFFQAQSFTDALVHAIQRTGELLAHEFPRQPDDRNELPNAVEEG